MGGTDGPYKVHVPIQARTGDQGHGALARQVPSLVVLRGGRGKEEARLVARDPRGRILRPGGARLDVPPRALPLGMREEPPNGRTARSFWEEGDGLDPHRVAVEAKGIER